MTLQLNLPVDKLNFNNLNQPLPTPTDEITLREYEGAPVPQQDAEFNFINLTDRINNLIDANIASDTAIVDAINNMDTVINNMDTVIQDISTAVTQNTANIPTFAYDTSTKTLSITS